ncbi:MAG: DUF1573 domain-containing protein [Planctomycetota bacterium]
MRTSLLPRPLLLALLSAGPFVSACSESPEPRVEARVDRSAGPEPEPAGALSFETLTHDFGAVDDTRPLEFGYAFVNTGAAPVEITAVKAGCGCIATELEQRTFAPGEGSVIRMSWEPEGRGRQTKSIDVVTDAGKAGMLRLRASADVTPVVTVSPPDAGFGDVPVGEGAAVRLFATSSDPRMTLLGVESSHPAVSAIHKPGAAVGLPREPWVIDVEVASSAPKGRLFATLTLRVEAHSERYDEVVRYSMKHTLSGNVVGKLAHEPFAFVFGTLPPKGHLRGQVMLSRPDEKPFQILSSRLEGLDCPDVKLFVDPLAGRGGSAYRLRIDGPVGDYIGPLTGASVIVTTDVPEDARITFPVLGRVGASGK